MVSGVGLRAEGSPGWAAGPTWSTPYTRPPAPSMQGSDSLSIQCQQSTMDVLSRRSPSAQGKPFMGSPCAEPIHVRRRSVRASSPCIRPPAIQGSALLSVRRAHHGCGVAQCEPRQRFALFHCFHVANVCEHRSTQGLAKTAVHCGPPRPVPTRSQ